ncbi:MAG: rubrerythrin family protein [Phycisphaerales bacterium]|nr:MAG: rubrerythrin family protein [Phycisphaerales bacterium]
MVTDRNLKDAFAGESQANRKYLAFAQRAAQESLPQIARLFRAAAQAETVHALNHFQAMRAVRSTRENLQEAIAGESFESEEMYPRYIATAMDEGAKLAMLSFNNAMEVEKVHRKLYLEALERVEAGEDLPPESIYVCGVCGNTVVGEPLEQCPVCGASKEKFQEVH